MIRKIFTILFVALLATMQAGAATYYTASLEITGSGHVSMNKLKTIQAGETLRLFLRPSEDWDLESVKVVLASDETTEIELNDYTDPNYIAYSFVAPEGDIIVRTVFVHTWFNVTIQQPEVGGTIGVSKAKARPDEEITITAYPDIEHYTSWVQVNRDDNSQEVSTYRENADVYTFTMPASDVLITGGFTPKEKYDITNEGGEHGSVQVKSTGVQDETIYVLTTPDKGYELDHVWAMKIESIPGGTHFESLDVTPVNNMLSSFVMPAAHVTTGAEFKKKLYPVNIKEGTDQADFSLYNDVTGFVGGDHAVVNIYPHDTSLIISKIVVTDEDDNELDYTIDHYTSDRDYYSLSFIMPYSPVDVRVRLKAQSTVPVVLAYDENYGTVTLDKETARPGETVNIVITPATDCVLHSLTAVAGYEVTGGGGGAHAPRREGSLWYEQQKLEVVKVDDTHYQITLPEQLANELTPNYLDDTQIKVEADFRFMGPMAIYCEDANTLYFVHDTPAVDYEVGSQYEGHTITNIWNGTAVTASGWSRPGWLNVASNVDTVLFTSGFADVRPTSCYSWFANFSSLTAVEGIENLNTSQVTNMNSMFFHCPLLVTLDLSGFDVSQVTNATSMFRACSALTTIYSNDTWNIATAESMFMGSTNLLGAVPYDGAKTGCDMANPVTGYFTGKWDISLAQVDDVRLEASDMAYTNETVNFTLVTFFSTIESVTVTGDRTGNEVTLTVGDGGTYSFVMPAEPVTITPVVNYSEGDAVAVLWCEDVSTLYFVNQPVSNLLGGTWDGATITAAWTGEKVTNNGWGTPGWHSVREQVTRVVFDPTFADVKPKSCYYWFCKNESLASIEGLEYLNTSEVTNMNSMFYNCKSLTSLDVNTFDVSRVTNSFDMFGNCSSLTTIYCNDTWNIGTSTGMFHGDVVLVGAVAYDALQHTSAMANPVTGYFTGKWAISIPDVEGGSVACEQTEAYTNEMVTIVVTPDQGYQFQSLDIVTADGGQSAGAPHAAPQRTSVDYNDLGDGSYSFKMPPAAVTIVVSFQEDVVTAIGDINASKTARTIHYNLQGQPVGENYRGIVIEDGHKKIVK